MSNPYWLTKTRFPFLLLSKTNWKNKLSGDDSIISGILGHDNNWIVENADEIQPLVE